MRPARISVGMLATESHPSCFFRARLEVKVFFPAHHLAPLQFNSSNFWELNRRAKDVDILGGREVHTALLGGLFQYSGLCFPSEASHSSHGLLVAGSPRVFARRMSRKGRRRGFRKRPSTVRFVRVTCTPDESGGLGRRTTMSCGTPTISTRSRRGIA